MHERSRDRSLHSENYNQQPERERVYAPAEYERHYAPLKRELHPDDAKQFTWKAKNGTVQSYQHVETHRHIHSDSPTGQFFDQQKSPITREAALDQAMGVGRHAQQQHQSPDSKQVETFGQESVCDGRSSIRFGPEPTALSQRRDTSQNGTGYPHHASRQRDQNNPKKVVDFRIVI